MNEETKKPTKKYRFKLECYIVVKAVSRTDAYTKIGQTLDSHHAVEFENTVFSSQAIS